MRSPRHGCVDWPIRRPRSSRAGCTCAAGTDDDDSSEIAPRPCFLARPLEEAAAEDGQRPRDQPIGNWIVEWKFDGIRAQLVRHGAETAIWLRGGDLARDRFPRIVRDAPVAFIASDLLALRAEDLRDRSIEVRRESLASILNESAGATREGETRQWGTPRQQVERSDTSVDHIRRSTNLAPASWEDAGALRAEATRHGHEGLMLKRRGSPYRAGRKRVDWWKWKVDPYTVDAVLVAAEPGSGRRAGLHSDCTFALRDGDRLVPFAKAYSGLTDTELVELDRWVRRHTTARHGPVRSVEPVLVFEIAFERVASASRHASGLAVRFPRILHWRRDKTPAEADELAALKAMAE